MEENKGEYNEVFNYFQKIYSSEILKVGKILGKGAFGEVRDIIYKDKILAGKLIEKNTNEISNEEIFSKELKGHNIIRIFKIYQKKIGTKYYDLIIMEKAILRDMKKFITYFHLFNLLKLIYINPFDEKVGNNLLRFFVKQIIFGLAILDNSQYAHFDIKPENLLITNKLIIKISDFGLLRKVNENITLPGGTFGYLTPEYYESKTVSREVATKQDYFAFGSSLFFLKYGKLLIEYNKYEEERIMNSDRIKDLIQRNIYNIKGKKASDRDFIKFESDLIHCNPEYRPTFEEIYRNKWINKDNEELSRVIKCFENEEEKLIMELQKSDYLIKKEKTLKKQKKYGGAKFLFKKRKKQEIVR